MLDLSIIVPTKNRPFFLEKLLNYQAGAGFRGVVIIGDASEGENLKKNQRVVEKFSERLQIQHILQSPQTSLIESTIQMLGQAASEFSVLSGDDDFLVPRELERCAAFLKTCPDYSCACGEQVYAFVEPASGGTMKIQQLLAGYSQNHEEPSASARIVQYSSRGRAVNTFSVQRTGEMHARWKKASGLGLDATKYHGCLHEVSVGVMSLIQGKQKKFSELYHVMLRHTEREPGMTSHQGDIGWLARMCRWDWSRDVPAIVHWWAAELVEREGLARLAAEEIAEAVFLGCWTPTMLRRRDELLSVNDRLPKYPKNSKEYFLQQIKKLRRLRPQKKPAIVSPDFQAIREVVECP